MQTHRVAATASIASPPQRIYSILADYHIGHPRILPRPPFVSMRVEQGGIGAGTQFELRMRILGRLRTYHGIVSEPQPGRMLLETDLGTGMVTSFIVESGDAGGGARVTIATESQVHGGVLGKIEAWIAGAVLRPVNMRELSNLAALK